MRRNLVFVTALALAASPAVGQSATTAPSAQADVEAPPAGKPDDQVTPVEPVDHSDPEHGVPPLGQSKEYRKRIQARGQAHKERELEVDADKPDVLLDVPDVSVEEISLEVNNLKANIALDAKVLNLLQLKVGVDLSVDRVKLLIKGVHAEALLKVRLKHVAGIVDRALTTIDRNPQLVTQLLATIDKTVATVGEVAMTALAPGGLLSQTVNMLGQTVQKVVDTTGRIIERTLDTTGQVVKATPVGDLKELKPLKEITDASGNIVREVEDSSGTVIRYTVDSTGKVQDVKVQGKGDEKK